MLFFTFSTAGVTVPLNEAFVFFFSIFVRFALQTSSLLVMLVFAFLLTERETETWEVLCPFMIRDKPLHVLFLAATELDCSKLHSQLASI